VKAVLFAALAVLASAQSGPVPEPARITGIVLRTDGKTPIAGARVVLAYMSASPSEDYATLSGSDGRFALQNIIPGRYVLRATSRGFIEAAYGAKRPKRPGAELDVSAGQTLENVTIQMTAGSVIAGRVYDDTGRLLPDVTVQAIQPRYDPDGRRTASMVLNTRTNDIGEYRLYWASPGTYYIAATAPEMYPSNPAERTRIVDEQYGGAQYVFRPTFYPNVLDEAQATPLAVEAGVEMSGIDFVLTRLPTVRVSGRIVDGVGAALAGRSDLDLVTARDGWLVTPSGANLLSISSVSSNSKGEFTFRAVPAGSYTLYANGPSGPIRSSGELRIQVGDRNVADLTVRVDPTVPTRIMGQAEFESARPVQRANLSFTSLDPADPARFATMINAEKFEVTLLEPGTYRLALNSAEDGYFLRWARSGLRDVLRDGLDSRTGATEPLEIMIGSTSSVVEGTVSDESRPAIATQVVLVPSDRRMRIDLFRTTTTDQTGRYVFKGVAPGDYKLFAWEDLEPFGYFDPVFLGKHETAGTPIHVEQNQSVSTNLRVIP
jgi:protocatechuate 3,4-dioxygenase beta subunit